MQALKVGDPVRVNARLRPGVGIMPRVGEAGHIEVVKENGNVVVLLADGSRALLASWEVDPMVDAGDA